MTNDSPKRSISIARTGPGSYLATNARGGSIEFGSGDDSGFTPVELLLTAIGGCAGIDVDMLTSRRAEPESFEILVEADSVQEGGGHHLADITATFRLRFPAGSAGDAARAVLPTAIERSHDRLCTVGRTVERGTPILMRADEP